MLVIEQPMGMAAGRTFKSIQRTLDTFLPFFNIPNMARKESSLMLRTINVTVAMQKVKATTLLAIAIDAYAVRRGVNFDV